MTSERPSNDVFTATIERALDELPAQFRDLLENVEILVEGEHPDEPDLYGLYEGVPFTERGGDPGGWVEPDRIYVFRRPLVEDFGDDIAKLRHEIRVTFLHELAHLFGIDEDRLDELGWA